MLITVKMKVKKFRKANDKPRSVAISCVDTVIKHVEEICPTNLKLFTSIVMAAAHNSDQDTFAVGMLRSTRKKD